jgi:hypothetical protein
MLMDLQMALAKGRLAVPLKIFTSQLCFWLKLAVVAPERRFAAPAKAEKPPL